MIQDALMVKNREFFTRRVMALELQALHSLGTAREREKKDRPKSKPWNPTCIHMIPHHLVHVTCCAFCFDSPEEPSLIGCTWWHTIKQIAKGYICLNSFRIHKIGNENATKKFSASQWFRHCRGYFANIPNHVLQGVPVSGNLWDMNVIQCLECLQCHRKKNLSSFTKWLQRLLYPNGTLPPSWGPC